jgi:hypothetical protein
MEYTKYINTKRIPIDLFLTVNLAGNDDVFIKVTDAQYPNIIILTRLIKNTRNIVNYHLPLPLTPENDLKISIVTNNYPVTFFDYNAKLLNKNMLWVSKESKELIDNLLYVAYYLPYLDNGKINLSSGAVISIQNNINNSTPAQVNRKYGIFRIDKPRMLNYNVNMRVYILLHELCHFEVPSSNEVCADNCALKHYLDLGFSQRESVFLMKNLFKKNDNERFKNFVKSLVQYNLGSYINFCSNVQEDLPRHRARYF